jgi:AraC-like DNA-binding protein
VERLIESSVEAFWVIAEGAAGVHRVPPDGCTDLVFEVRAGRSSARLVGVSTALSEVPLDAQARYSGIRFRPWVAATLFGTSALGLRDRAMEVPGVPAAHDFGGLERLAARLLGGFRPTAQMELVRRASQLLEAAEGGLPLVASELHTSERTLRRAFDQTVGLGPKALTRILRAQRALRGLERGHKAGPLAYELGFADQAHLTRDVQALTGLTPSAWRSQQRGRILQERRLPP